MADDSGFDDIVHRLKRNKDSGYGCSLLIGAGCSVSAGIPLAREFVDIIKDEYEYEYNQAAKKDYPNCMGELAGIDRRTLVNRYIDAAKINPAYIGIAQLIDGGFINRVLTTNFDPLVVRACAMFNIYPAVYDMAGKPPFASDSVGEKSVFHLHGQRDGFIQLHRQDQVDQLSKSLNPVFDDSARSRTWIVVGYSGESDPVLDHLARMPAYDYRLFWIGYRDAEPTEKIKNEIVNPAKGGQWISGFDADGFFIRLADSLDCPAHPIFLDPIDYLESTLDFFGDAKVPGEDITIPWLDGAREKVRRVKEAVAQQAESEDGTGTKDDREDRLAEAQRALASGENQKVIQLLDDYGPDWPPEMIELLSWAYVVEGNALSDQALAKDGDEADALFVLAGENYAAALEIKPDRHEALNNWGIALKDQAKSMEGDEADALFALAGEKYAAALEIKADYHEALNNWGIAYADQARSKEGDEADALFALAAEKLVHANIIRLGWGSYDLACIAALTGREDECRKWLEDSRDTGHLPSKQHLEEDTDLDSMRDTDWFKEFLETLPD